MSVDRTLIIAAARVGAARPDIQAIARLSRQSERSVIRVLRGLHVSERTRNAIFAALGLDHDGESPAAAARAA